MTMRKTLIALFLCLVMVGTIGAAVTATAAPCVNRLDTPQLVAPENGATPKVGQTITFEWKAVDGAVAYRVEAQKETAKHEWTHDWAFIINAPANAPTTTFSRQAMHAQTHRWHVIAIASNPMQNSQPSEWHTFTVEA
jgi:hypothetical protein